MLFVSHGADRIQDHRVTFHLKIKEMVQSGPVELLGGSRTRKRTMTLVSRMRRFSSWSAYRELWQILPMPW